MIEIPMADTAAGQGAVQEWPTAALVDAVRADRTWAPMPFSEFIVKTHGRCNIACDYCYMYEMADQSWRSKPMALTRATVDRVAGRLADHLHAHAAELPEVIVKLHGGEALLVGAQEIDYAAAAFRAAAPEGTAMRLSLTTNAILLDDENMLETLLEHDVKVTVSLDGGKEAHDRHRKYANGKGSHDKVMQGIRQLLRPRYSHLLQLILCYIDVDNDPLDVYEELAAVGAPAVDFSLPLGNWTEPPPGWVADGTAFADWLIPVFDRWYGTTPVPTTVRLFDDIMAMVLGGSSTTEGIGIGTFRTLTVDTDGSLELVDTLRSTFEGAPSTGLDVFHDSFDAARDHPGVVARQIGVRGLSETCKSCALMDICGGGQYAHRYRQGTGFLNPSVFCADLTKLIVHIRDRVIADVEALAATQEA
ncbi:FxsB family cyclophane-forming radical SAM/SPASM peptide maturase [Streptomyces sp. NPDC049040]|uniref:FxsB family cyclophane-forming radical SAM/SPASM peptide maturase n=1 Tax=Streptomyces sp. NPDC049040 TaxID=3365593 RepID=UPI00371C339B